MKEAAVNNYLNDAPISSATVAPIESPSDAEKRTHIPEFRRRRPRFCLTWVSWMILVFFIAVSAGALVSHYSDDDGEGRDEDSYDQPVLVLAFVVPSLVLFAVTLVVVEVGARRLGSDAIKEAVNGDSAKDGCIATWTNISFVSALVLSMTVPQIFALPEPPRAMINQWAVFFFFASSGMNLICILISVNLILYTSPLQGTDMEIFCSDFPACTSIPSQYMFVGLLYATAAVILVIYHIFGVHTGIVVGILAPIAFVYPFEHWYMVSQWKRPQFEFAAKLG